MTDEWTRLPDIQEWTLNDFPAGWIAVVLERGDVYSLAGFFDNPVEPGVPFREG